MKERRDTKGRVLRSGEYQSADGRYSYRYIDHNGKTRYVYSWTLTATDRTPKGKKAGKCLRDLEVEIAKDIQDGINTVDASKATFEDYYKKYMRQNRRLKESTRYNYNYMYNTYVKDTLGSRLIASITYSDLKELYNGLIYDDKRRKASSVGNIHNIINPVFNLAVRDNVIRKNPATGIRGDLKKEAEETTEKKAALTIEQQKALVKFIHNHEKFGRWYPLTVYLLGTGCRIGEGCATTWDDCDFKRNTIAVKRTVHYYPDEEGKCNGYTLSTPKTAAGRRKIPMLPAVREMLMEERKRQMLEGFNRTVIDGVSGFVFQNRSGRLLGPRCYNYALKKIVNTYNAEERLKAIVERREPILLPDISPHTLRHTFCTRLCESGMNVKVIQEIMGHSDISTTMDIYTDVTNDFKRSEFEALEKRYSVI